MKAVVLHNYGPSSSLACEEVPDPVAGIGEVLVQIHATSVNPVDWMLRSGIIRDLIPIDFPFIPGHDLAGVVEALGEGVTNVSVGDRVMGIASRTYAGRCVARARGLVRIPDGLETTHAAALPLVVQTGDQLVREGARAASGQTVLITGALGGVGRSAVYAASRLGANVVAGVRGARLGEARRLPGVTNAVALDDDRAIDRLPRLDAVADTIGGDLAARLAARVRPGGRFGCFPSTRAAIGNPAGVEVNPIVARPEAATIRDYAQAVCDGRLEIPISRIIPLEEAGRAHRLAEQGAGGKIILQP